MKKLRGLHDAECSTISKGWRGFFGFLLGGAVGGLVGRLVGNALYGPDTSQPEKGFTITPAKSVALGSAAVGNLIGIMIAIKKPTCK